MVVESVYAAALFVVLLLNGGEPSRSDLEQSCPFKFTPFMNRSENREMEHRTQGTKTRFWQWSDPNHGPPCAWANVRVSPGCFRTRH